MALPCTRNVSDNDQNILYYPQQGLPAMPLELLLRIVSLMQGPAIPWYGESPMWNEERERRECLRTFCQLCRSLRAALLPVLWERLEACTVRAERSWGIRESTGIIAARSRTMERELIGQLSLMINSTALYASYVRVVNVAIEARFSPTALPKLARAMALMPNLHTIQIICNANMHLKCKSDQFQNAFKKHVYPSVRRASLPHQAASILASFPEVVDVYINQVLYRPNFDKFLQAVAKNCPKVEYFGWEPTLWTHIKMIPQRLPNLRRLDCRFTNTMTADVNQFVELATLKNLEEFTLTVKRDPNDRGPIPENLVMDAARKAFAGSSSPNKCLTIHFYGQTRVETFGAD